MNSMEELGEIGILHDHPGNRRRDAPLLGDGRAHHIDQNP